MTDQVPGFEIGEELTRTDRSIIYVATKKGTGTPAVLKLVRNDGDGHREIEMHRLIEKANPSGPIHIVRLLDYHEDGDNLWLGLEHFDQTLDTLNPTQMTPLAIMNIALDSSKGLYEMHRADTVDDDVKPENLAYKAGSGRVVHLDLGCVRRRGQRPVGYTPDYAAPEISEGKSSDTSPCYGWARTIEQIVTGKFGLGPYELLFDHAPWVGRNFAALVARCCFRDPSRRPSVTELYEAVKLEVEHRKRCSRCDAVKFHDGECPNCSVKSPTSSIPPTEYEKFLANYMKNRNRSM